MCRPGATPTADAEFSDAKKTDTPIGMTDKHARQLEEAVWALWRFQKRYSIREIEEELTDVLQVAVVPPDADVFSTCGVPTPNKGDKRRRPWMRGAGAAAVLGLVGWAAWLAAEGGSRWGETPRIRRP